MTNLAATKLQKTCQACGEPRGSKDPAKFCGYCHKAGARKMRPPMTTTYCEHANKLTAQGKTYCLDCGLMLSFRVSLAR